MCVDTGSQEYKAVFRKMVAKEKVQYLAGSVEQFKSCMAFAARELYRLTY